MDKRLRALERRWQASGSEEDHTAFLVEKSRSAAYARGHVWRVWFSPSIVGYVFVRMARQGQRSLTGRAMRYDVASSVGLDLTATSQPGYYVVDPMLAQIAEGEIPLSPALVFKAPPRILRVLKRRSGNVGLEVELPTPVHEPPPPPVPPPADWEGGGTLGPDWGDQISHATGHNEHGWWVFVRTPGGDYIPDSGYESQARALEAGEDAARDWLLDNDYYEDGSGNWVERTE